MKQHMKQAKTLRNFVVIKLCQFVIFTTRVTTCPKLKFREGKKQTFVFRTQFNLSVKMYFII